MSTGFDWHHTLIYHLENSWLELLNMAAACIEENLIDARIARFELMSLRGKLREAKEAQNQAKLEACLSQCKRLLIYYRALHKQKQRVEETGLPFSQRALERLKDVES